MSKGEKIVRMVHDTLLDGWLDDMLDGWPTDENGWAEYANMAWTVNEDALDGGGEEWEVLRYASTIMTADGIFERDDFWHVLGELVRKVHEEE